MIEKNVEELICYAKSHLYLGEEDAVYKRNLLLRYFACEKPYEGEVDEQWIASLALPDEIIAPVRAYLLDKGLSENEAEREIVWILGLLSPLPSQVNDAFWALYEAKPSLASDYLYDLSVKNYYIQKTKIAKNIVWEASFPDGPSIEVSINLSRPEKNNKDVAKLQTQKSVSYPKCMLCHENLGFWGNEQKPPRETLRVIPLTLDEERWYLQYSPYSYYNHHLICFSEKHEAMEINANNLSKLFAFVDQFPHYFIGSNADLPIVGGSILDHEHFQGGGHRMPIMKAKAKQIVAQVDGIKVEILDFYHPSLLLEGKDRAKMLSLAMRFIDKWHDYDDLSQDIVSRDADGQHNTATPILEKKDGLYRLFLILRNNRTDGKYPDGIFHAHPEYRHIKSEGIGLIEAAGLFVLPARLQRQCGLVENVLKGEKTYEEVLEDFPDMADFEGMVEELARTQQPITDYIGEVCRKILGNIAVFKNTEEGQKAYLRFIEEVLA